LVRRKRKVFHHHEALSAVGRCKKIEGFNKDVITGELKEKGLRGGRGAAPFHRSRKK